MKNIILTTERTHTYWLFGILRFGKRSLIGFKRDHPRNELDIFWFPVTWYDR